jgi:hypothetical protein
MSDALYESLQGVIANRPGKEVSMEDRNDIHYKDDALDRELNALVREMEQEEVIRRTVIEMLVLKPQLLNSLQQRHRRELCQYEKLKPNGKVISSTEQAA